MKILMSFIALATLLSVQPSAKADEWNKHWSVGPNPELRINAGDAGVTVEAGETNAMDATVTTRGWSIGSSGVRVTEHQSGIPSKSTSKYLRCTSTSEIARFDFR
jgi:hypothetical protein